MTDTTADKFTRFLNEPTPILPRHERWCQLIFANGGFATKSWNDTHIIEFTNGLTHQIGLDSNETLELLQISAFLDGMQAAGFDWNTVFAPFYKEYTKRYLGDTQTQPTTH